MSTIMSTGQITLVDLTDQRTNSFYLQADQSKIQVYDVNKKTYSPDYTTSQGSITITPSFFFGNDDYSNKIEQADISYYINDSTVAATKISTSASSSEDCYQKGINLIIAQNIGKGTFTNSILKIRAVIFANSIVDEKTGLSNSSNIEATIEFAKVETGANGASGEDGISITNVQQQYLINKSSTTPPDKTDSGWSSSHGAWTEGSYLWIRTAITYSNGLVEYTDPYCDSSWKAAADGVSKLSERIDGVEELIEALQKEVDGAIETWYLEGDPSKKEQRPWYDSSLEVQDSDAEHEGDLYFDTITGKSYRFLKQGEVYIWQIITDTELSGALSDILQLQDDVKTKVTIYYGEQPTGNNIQINDMWVDSEGNFYQYIKKSDGVYEWSLASYSVSRVETEYAESSSNTTAPESGWSTNSPVWKANTYIWQRTVTYFKNNVVNPIYSNPICVSAAAARGIVISGEQVFKSSDGGATFTPSAITLTASLIGGVTVGAWYYKNGTNWQSFNSTNTTLSISSGHAAFGSGMVATIKVEAAEDKDYYDIISLYKVIDGQDTHSVFLTNENITFAANAAGTVAAKTATCRVVAYTGVKKVTPRIGQISGAPDGMTVIAGTASDNEIPLTISVVANSNLGSAKETSGAIYVPITYPVSTTLIINWSKVNTGATGEKGDSAVFAIVESNSKIVFSDFDDSNISLYAYLYVGGKAETKNVTYSWSSIPAGTSSTSSTLTVKREDVTNIKTFICTISYNGQEYIDRITISDKTDPVYCVIESSKGDKFTNGNVTTTLTCRVFNGTGELDEQGTKYIYTWEKYDAEGQKDDSWTRTGKTTNITSSDVSAKAVFSCTITK